MIPISSNCASSFAKEALKFELFFKQTLPFRDPTHSWHQYHQIVRRYCCTRLQHTATHCNELQHTATHCSTLQRTAAHCNTLIDDVNIARSCDAIVALATAATAAARDTWKDAVEEAYGESVAEFQEGIASLRPLFVQRYIFNAY